MANEDREAFERYMRTTSPDTPLGRNGEGYAHLFADETWEGFKAGARAARRSQAAHGRKGGPVCPACRIPLLFECTGCSDTNYPPPSAGQEPFGWWMQDSNGVGYFTRTPGPDSLRAYNSTPGYSATPLHAGQPAQPVDLQQFLPAVNGLEIAANFQTDPDTAGQMRDTAEHLRAVIDEAARG